MLERNNRAGSRRSIKKLRPATEIVAENRNFIGIVNYFEKNRLAKGEELELLRRFCVADELQSFRAIAVRDLTVCKILIFEILNSYGDSRAARMAPHIETATNGATLGLLNCAGLLLDFFEPPTGSAPSEPWFSEDVVTSLVRSLHDAQAGLRAMRTDILDDGRRFPASREIQSEAGPRLTFMVSMSKAMKRLFNSWHDSEVAALSAVTFKLDEDLSPNAVRAARRRYPG